jgi:hypothetical protein
MVSRYQYVDKESFGLTEQHMVTNPDLIVTPASATSSATNGFVSHMPREGDTGKGEANNASTWDEFPNGRFGDINSPAFGNQDLWGGFGRIVSTIDSDCSPPIQETTVDTWWLTS